MTLAGHVHVTEREVAHTHPNGAFDDAAWEDCTFCSFVEFLRASGHPELPATHLEAENLRDASGRAATGGTNLGDCVNGAKSLHGITVAAPVLASGIWARLTPGTCAAVQGAMAFPVGSHWRRWDTAFNGNHCVFVARLDATDRVWWCDPNAPTAFKDVDGALSPWDGEWMSKADFLTYVGAFPGYALVAPIVAPIVADKETTVFTVGRIVRQSWTANGTDGALRAKPDRSLAPFTKIPSGQAVISELEGTTDDGNNWRGVVWPVGNPTNAIGAYFLRTGPGVPVDHDFVAGAFVPVGVDPAAIETARRNGYNAGVAAVQQAASGIRPI